MAEKNVSDEYDSVKADLAKLQSDVTALMEALASSGKSQVERTRQEAKPRLREGAEEVGKRAQDLGDTLEKQYEEKPLLMLIGAFLLGVVLGRSNR